MSRASPVVRRRTAGVLAARAVTAPGDTTKRVSSAEQKQLVLILARAFASNLSTPTLLVDTRGYLVYYNEAAELVVGRRFAETGELPIDEWLEPFAQRTSTGDRLPREQQPTWIALNERQPGHSRYTVTSTDGVEREVDVSAFPLFAQADEFVGAIVLFWRRRA